MSIIKTHNITLYGGNEIYKIVLRPLSDEHLPLLYKWNADSEVLYMRNLAGRVSVTDHWILLYDKKPVTIATGFLFPSHIFFGG